MDAREHREVLRMSGIVKRFGALTANAGIDVALRANEILALLGENGAGKTTLMNILFGHYVADAGRIEAFGRPLKPGDPKASLAAGIGMVHQHFALADNLSVLDNVMLGTESLLALRSNRRAAKERLTALSEEFGFEIAADVLVRDLSVGQKQRVEILKALYREAKILILDEPTAVLTPQETERLFGILRLLVDKGLSIIFISHKLKEILAVCHRIVVLRRGAVTCEVPVAQADEQTLAQAMVGRELQTERRHAKSDAGELVLELKGAARRGVRHACGLRGVDLQVREHEIVGISGVAGNGQQELAALVSGLAKPDAGSVSLLGEGGEPAALQTAARIPDDRVGEGIVGGMAVWENLISGSQREFARFGFLRQADIRKFAAELLERYDIRAASLDLEAKLLSGGNIQRLILARELSKQPRFIFVNQPTQGLDVGAVENVHAALLAARARGAGVLMVTEDLDELFLLADRVAVLYRGELSDFFAADQIDMQQLGLLMAGGSQRAPAMPNAA